ncbi:MAG TPA: N-acetyltransferase [Oleiagrimonas sp.]|nr:N-acetyltransferase [Oleiagrimonas sp.]
MALTIRPACETDAEAAVPLIYSSGPAAFDYVFARAGADARAFLARAFVDGAGEFGHRNHVVGELDGKVVAAGAGFGYADTRSFTLAAARQILRHYGWRAGGPIVRGLRTERLIHPPTRGEFYLGHLGVAPTARGHGVGSALVEWLLAHDCARTCQCAVLDVAADNPRAQALYERLGFRVTGERHSSLRNARGAVPTQRRMRRSLSPDAP